MGQKRSNKKTYLLKLFQASISLELDPIPGTAGLFVWDLCWCGQGCVVFQIVSD